MVLMFILKKLMEYLLLFQKDEYKSNKIIKKNLKNRAVILDNGKIVADGLFFDILSKPELLEKHRLGLPPGFSIKKLWEDKSKLSD